jgi:hypothetical protein
MEPFGREIAIKKLLAASYEKVGKDLSILVYRYGINMANNLRKEFKNMVDSSKIDDISKIDDLISEFKLILSNSLHIFGDFKEIDKVSENLSRLLPSEFISYREFIDSFHVDYKGRDIFMESFEGIKEFIESFDINEVSSIKQYKHSLHILRYGNIFEKFLERISLFPKILSINDTLKEVIDDVFDTFLVGVLEQLKKIESS